MFEAQALLGRSIFLLSALADRVFNPLLRPLQQFCNVDGLAPVTQDIVDCVKAPGRASE